MKYIAMREHYLEMVVPDNAGKAQIDATAMAFDAGAYSVMDYLSGDNTDEKIIAFVEEIRLTITARINDMEGGNE